MHSENKLKQKAIVPFAKLAAKNIFAICWILIIVFWI